MITTSIIGGCNYIQCVNFSIDKLAFTVEIPDNFNVREFINDKVKRYIQFEDLKDVQEVGDYKFYLYNYRFNDFYMSFGFKNIKKGQERDHIRIELNPNKKKPEELYLLFACFPSEIIKTLKINRLDAAIDFKEKLHPEFFYDPDKRKSNIYYNSGDIETVYIGSEQSDIQFRIYDKRREVLYRLKLKSSDLTPEKINEIRLNENIDLSSPDYWRLEVQIRKKGLSHVIHNNYNPFEKLECFAGFKTGNYHYSYDHFLCSVEKYGLHNALKKIPVTTRKRYLSFFKDISTSIEHPKDIWNKHFNQCFSDIKNRLQAIFKSPDIYE